MGLLKAANSTPLQWVDVEQAPYPSGYQPVMALAQNHIFFLNVPGTPAGSADIYVIHCKSVFDDSSLDADLISSSVDYFQPDAQAFPTSNGTIPATNGQTASFFQNEGVRALLMLVSLLTKPCPTNQVQEAFAFIPSDCSATYVLNVETNTTQTLAGPSTKDAAATYYAGISSLVQLDSQGGVSYLPFSPNDTSANAAAQWSKVGPLATAAPPSSSLTSSRSATTSSGTSKPSGSSTSSSGSKSNGAAAIAPRDIVGAILGSAVVLVALFI